MNLETIVFENKTLKIIDQKQLPLRLVYMELKTLQDVLQAIKKLHVRGAPAIGITAAYGFYLHLLQLEKTQALSETAVMKAAKELAAARPTAVNLSWAVDEMYRVYRHFKSAKQALFENLEKKALAIHRQDKETCRKIGDSGSALIPQQANILTHCNAGALATGGMGTALSVVYRSVESGKKIHVFVDETRPVGQGARLTYWELKEAGVPATLISDNMAGALMKDNKIDAVIVGADRIAGNGDVANKIGTYSLAVLAGYHKIPFYVAAPLSSFDRILQHGGLIPIETRGAGEILDLWGIPDSTGYRVYNPAFDVTPCTLITNIITEKGLLEKPFKENIDHLFI